MNGMDICKKLRSEGNNTYIIMLTAVDDEYNKIIRSSGLGAYHFSSPHEIFYHHFYKDKIA
mgnify:CR=1 FL=1